MKKIVYITILAFSLSIHAKAQTTIPNVSLYDIQYTTAVPANSPYMNQNVTTGGIVTASYNGGYWIQTSYTSTWSGLYVWDGSHVPVVGDSILLTGEVVEFYNETELETITGYTVVSAGLESHITPTVVAFNTIQNEMFEGLLVKVKDVTDKRYNASAAWYVFYDSTMTAGINSEDTVDNIIYTYTFTQNKKYNITGVIHFEYANWIEPRNQLDIDSINVTASGIKNYQNNFADVNIYPNPNNGVFTVSVNVLSDENNTDIALTDITGRIVYKEQLDTHAGSSSLPINTSNLEKGTYFIQISNSQSSIVKKVIVQ
jgi:hypothetical protein